MPQSPPISRIVLMGVAGCGKSAVGAALSARLGAAYLDGDDLHAPENIEKMSRGIPLSDEDRWPWLEAIAAWLDERIRKREPGIVSCSALKKTYRRLLLDGRPDVQLVYLKGEMPLIGRRMARRVNHFMPPSLLESQFDALEEPDPTEWPIIVPIEVISYVSRPVSHSVRLFAVMLAGHITLKVFAGFVVSMSGLGTLGMLGAILPFAMTVALTALELLMAIIQAYVFTMLTCMYLNDALHPGH